MKIIAQNKKASHEYFILDTYEAGIVLTGTEIKSVRASKVNIADAYISIKDNQAHIVNMHIAKYDQGNIFNHTETRERRLLLHKKEIRKMFQKIQLEGLTIIPLKVYLNQGLAKLEIGVCQGKKLYDKRNDMKEADAKRKVEKALKNY